MILRVFGWYPCSMYLLVAIVSLLCFIGEAIEANTKASLIYFVLYVLNISFLSYTLDYPEKVQLKLKYLIFKETNGS